MDDKTKNIWDVFFGFVTPIVAIATLIFGLGEFEQGEKNRVQLENDLITHRDTVDFQRKLWLERLTAYQAISDAAGKIAACDKNDPQYKSLIHDFDGLYWGRSIIVFDDDVEAAMKGFHLEISDFMAGRSSPARIKDRAIDLAEACRKSIKTGTPP